MRRILLVLVLSLLLAFGNGCVAGVFWLQGKNAPPPNSPTYRMQVSGGIVADIAMIPLAGLGAVWLIIDLIYLFAWDGGYASRYYRSGGEYEGEDYRYRRRGYYP